MNSSSTWRRPLAAIAAAALAVLLSGCLKMDGDLTIADETVNGRLLVAMATEVTTQLGMTTDEIFAGQDDELAGVPGVTVNDYDDGDWVGAEYLLDRVALDDLNAVAEEDPDGLQIFYDPDAGSYEFLMVVDLDFMSDLTDADVNSSDSAELAAMLETFEVNIAVTFPGEVIEHNGKLSGTTVSWQPDPGIRSELRAVGREDGAGNRGAGNRGPGGATDPDATTAPGGSGDGSGEAERDPQTGELLAGSSGGNSWPVVVAVVALVLLAAGGVATALLVRRRRGQPAAALASGQPVTPDQPTPSATDRPTQPMPAVPPTESPRADQPTHSPPSQPPATPDSSGSTD